MFKRLGSLLRALISRRNFEAGMNEELRFHIERYAEDLMRSGVDAEEARRRARLEFGGVNTVESECREARGLRVFDELSRQVRYAARVLRKAPGFTITAVLTVALCLGANLAIFAVIDSVLLRPLPFPAANKLVTIFNTYPKAGVDRDGSSLTNYYERRGRIAALRSISIYRLGQGIVGDGISAKREQVTQISPDFFATLGVGPAFGRAFSEGETRYQTDHVAILSNEYWRSHFHADPNVLGRQIRVDSFPKTVVGVLPPGFRFLSSEAPVYVPLSSRPEDRAPNERHSGGNFTQMVARLAPSATLAEAQAQIDAQNTSLEADDPQAKMMAAAGFRSLQVPLHADHVAAVRPTLLLLEAAVFTLLLIGAANLLNLLLIRANGRAREVIVRQALGASRQFVVSEVLVETMLLTLSGSMLGLAVGAGGIRLLGALGVDQLPLGAHIHFDMRLAMAALAAAISMGAALGLPVAWFHLKGAGHALRAGTRSATVGRTAQILRQSFVIAQVALALVLAAGAGLLGLSLKRVLSVAPGFRPDHVLTAQISLIGNKYPDPSTGLAFGERLTGELSRQPGVASAGVIDRLPFSGNDGKSAATVVGHVLRPGEAPRGHYSYGVGGDYFRAMGLTLKAGRFLEASDSRARERVCVVDEDFARYYWPGTNPLRKRLFQGGQAGKDAEAFTVAGIVGSVKQAGLTEETAQGAVYYPYIYRPDGNIYVVVRGNAPTQTLRSSLERVVRQIDPELAVNDVKTMDDRITGSLMVRRSPALLAGLFSALALLLTGIGTYGVLSYAVAQRNREIGVRMALGAEPGRIRAEFFGVALRLFCGGAVLGGIGVWLIGKAMTSVLFHVPALSVPVLGGAAGVIGLVCILACFWPAQRASRVSPMQALAET